MDRASATTRLSQTVIGMAWVLLALLAASAAAQDCPPDSGVSTDIEQVRADCLDAIGSLVALDLPVTANGSDRTLAALEQCAHSARMLGHCKGREPCLFNQNSDKPQLARCGASPRRLSALASEAMPLWTPSTDVSGQSATAVRPSSRQRLEWDKFLFNLYGERCRSLSGCWSWAKSFLHLASRSSFQLRAGLSMPTPNNTPARFWPSAPE